MLHAVFDERDALGMILRQKRIVGADLFDEAAVPGRGSLGNDDA